MKKIDTLVLALCLGALSLMSFSLLSAEEDSKEMQCQSNLKDIHRAARIFSSEHELEFPWTLPIADGGSETSSTAARLWSPLSNFVKGPSTFYCPADTTGSPAPDWATFRNHDDQKVSYALGTDSYQHYPESLFASDRNFAGSRGDSESCGNAQVSAAATSMNAAEVAPIRWYENIHNEKGHLMTSDGSVEMVTTEGFRKKVALAKEPDVNHHMVKPARGGSRRGDN